MARRSSGVGANVRWGLGWGCALAAVYSAFVVGLSALDGGRSVASHGASVTQVVGIYWAAGIAAGALVGLLRPVLHTTLGRVVAGWLAGALAYGAVGLVRDGPTAKTAAIAAGLGFVVGVPAALWFGADEDDRREASPE